MADTDLIERLTLHAASWRRDDAFKARDPEAEAAIAEEAATALAERGAQYERLAGRMDAMAADNQRLRAECEGLRAALEDSLPAMNATERLASIKAAGYPRSEEEMLHRIIDNFLDKRRAALSQKETGDAA